LRRAPKGAVERAIAIVLSSPSRLVPSRSDRRPGDPAIVKPSAAALQFENCRDSNDALRDEALRGRHLECDQLSPGITCTSA
jgi:hypothetical protein